MISQAFENEIKPPSINQPGQKFQMSLRAVVFLQPSVKYSILNRVKLLSTKCQLSPFNSNAESNDTPSDLRKFTSQIKNTNIVKKLVLQLSSPIQIKKSSFGFFKCLQKFRALESCAIFFSGAYP